MTSRENGNALLSVVVISAVLLAGAAATIRTTRSELWHSSQNVAHQQAFYVAEAGVQRAIAQLDLDRATAATSTGYTYALADQSFGSGTYSFTVEQDPLFASDPRRKRITSTGELGPQESTVVSHVVVQNEVDCPLLLSDQGSARLVTNGVATTLFDGRIVGNLDVEFNFLADALVNGEGTVQAGRDFVENGALSLLATMDANLVRAGNFLQGPLHLHLLLVDAGIHFANGANGHGVQQAVTAETFPIPDYERIRSDARTIVVNADNVPFGSWDSTSGTWIVNSAVGVAAATEKIYYVEGNARLSGLSLAREATGMVVARGWLTLQNLSILNTDLLNGSADTQQLVLVAEESVYVGRQLLSMLPLSLESESVALANLTGLGVAAVEAFDRNLVYAYSEKGEVWVKGGTVDAASELRTCIIAKDDATLAYTASLLSTVREVGT